MANWISIAEEKPKEPGLYLVALKDTTPLEISDDEIIDMSHVEVMHYDAEQFIFSDGNDWYFNVLLEHPKCYGDELTHWMPLPDYPHLKTTSPTDSTIFTHTEAANIVELFEDLLDRFGIDIPDPDRDKSENPARLYGMTYFDLVFDVEQIIIKILEKKSQGSNVVNYIFGEGEKA